MIDFLFANPSVSCLGCVGLHGALKAGAYGDPQLNKSSHASIQRPGLVRGRGECLIGLKDRGMIFLDRLECVR
mgnify:CR=1 FL=1